MNKIVLIAFFALCYGNISGYSQTTEKLTESVYFNTSDSLLQKLYHSAEEKAKWNIAQFGKYKVLVEGAGYNAVWLETQPMGGYMYAKRDLDIARNNFEIFMDYQRSDGRLPGMISKNDTTLIAHYGWLQGFCFASPAFETYFLLNWDKAFIGKLYNTLEKFDDYLWRTRDSDGDECLETWCVWDTGEDNGIRFGKAPNAWPLDSPPSWESIQAMSESRKEEAIKGTHQISDSEFPLPIESMDIMSYSYSCRTILSRVSAEIGNGKDVYWKEKAEKVRAALKSRLWDFKEHACFDKDRSNKKMDILLHNNLRCMYFGSFDQQMADEFIRYHLMNRNEFWTPFPLPSIAANDKMFRNEPGNSWSGQPQGLTYQRSIGALENYGHFAELTLLGQKFLDNLKKNTRFTQQYDPFTGVPNSTSDGYGPAILTTLEFVTRMFGIHVSEDKIYWSCIDSPENYQYAQKYRNSTYQMESNGRMIDCYVNGKKILSFSKGIRIITDLDGQLIGVVGIETKKKKAIVRVNDKVYSFGVSPNSSFSFSGRMKKNRSIPFYKPF